MRGRRARASSWLALIGAIACPVAVLAAEDIAVIDYQSIFEKYEGTADAQRTLDLEMKEWEQEAKTMRDEVTKLEEELKSQELMLSEERLKEKQDLLRQKKDAYENFAESVFGVSGKAATRNQELTRPIAEKILASIEKIGRERNLKIILDAGGGGVVWAEDDVNLTELVLDELSTSAKSSTPAEQQAPPPSDPPADESPQGAAGRED
jgi:Skp family chaperone for outer membrane proteins